MTSLDSELNKISTELKHLSLKRQQLLERKKLQCIFQELKNRVQREQPEEGDSYQHEIDSIDDKLNQLAERKAELQKNHDNMVYGNDEKNSLKGVSKCTAAHRFSIILILCSFSLLLEITSVQKVVPDGPGIFFVEHPDFPAPTVILDMEKLPPRPTRTQCPECEQFIMTETFTSISSVTWLMCFMTALIGCIAGCCLIPFCMDRFKSTTHRCPKCRTSIITIKQM
ncbi:U11/U12 small nuclear ribonucleoprotein 25 kDa protein isoform X1 [Gymnodraco acuticeps]|uniref:U11/U12 small nuclear ribonucleoprotein 25 kDa protein isoform X1 n=1 Tax=Gymnodraco acuticeps TaxID=8218 RepID=A0A6P8UFW5_GYMAC|nr:U11/U12 small nuclear ribonucleoprotein 25 kDa protein isoform X1 [Gymnodraco acuticeps]XP_034075995.1 U11/U12 small nuclear ribonucleoprotein 25 kDa protein isoform X1 [Gymnodraco acuticeps]